jgi:diguanylate cyclase (GGDEF)-like protein
MMRKTLSYHVALMCALVAAALIVLGALYWQQIAAGEAQRGQDRVEEVLCELGWLAADIGAADTAGQAYRDTQAEPSLARYHAALASADLRLTVLARQLEGDAGAAPHLSELTRLVRARSTSDAARSDEIRQAADALETVVQERLARSAAAGDAASRYGRLILLAGGSLLLLGLVAAAITAIARIDRPLARIIAGGAAIAGGDYARRIPVFAHDEFGVLCESFNNLAVRLKAEQTINQRASAELRDVNEQLVIRGSELEARGRIIDVLGKMAHRLQSCDSEEEFADVVRRFAAQVLPQVPGVLYLLNNSRNMLRQSAEWNSPSHHRSDFRPSDCWALRRGHAHVVSGVDVEVVCHHVEETPDLSYRCFPMLAQGETLGLLYIEEPSAADPERLATARAAIADHWRIEIMVENIALALGNHRLREALRVQSIRDPLTGLFNRRYLEETLELEFARASRSKVSLAVMMLDVDHFKRFNDNFGHDAGDAVLKTVGQVLAGGMRRGDITCRYGGEEFTIVAPGAGLEDAQRRADALRQAVAAINLVHNGRPLGAITCSLGVAAFPLHGATPAEVLQAADEALYRAKNGGRNRVEVAPARETATVAIDAARA